MPLKIRRNIRRDYVKITKKRMIHDFSEAACIMIIADSDYCFGMASCTVEKPIAF